MSLDAISILRYSYLAAALAVSPAFNNHSDHAWLMARTYSPPLSSAEKEKKEATAKKTENEKEGGGNVVSQLLDEVAGWQVPHDWFWTFYAISVTMSAFWPGEALYLHGPAYEYFAANTRTMTTTMTSEQIKITWIMMLIQGGRRMYECLTLSQAEETAESEKHYSTMWGGHWVLGALFYAATSVAIWIEGVPALEAHKLSLRDLVFHAPTLRTIFSVLVFILASGFQHDCHTYLAFLKKNKSASTSGKASSASAGVGEYKLPTHPAFHLLISPHYTAECLIYLSLAFVSAPTGDWVNLTMLSALGFVTVNLGVTAALTRGWYRRKFGEEAIRGKWNMIPPIY